MTFFAGSISFDCLRRKRQPLTRFEPAIQTMSSSGCSHLLMDARQDVEHFPLRPYSGPCHGHRDKPARRTGRGLKLHRERRLRGLHLGHRQGDQRP